jgi:hypothetical protein
MKTKVLLILITFLSISSFAQNILSFKIYQNTDIIHTRYTDSQSGNVTTENNWNFNRISLAVNLLSKKGFSHEVELFIPEFSKPIKKFQFPIKYKFGNIVKFDYETTSYSLRYELHKLLTNKSERIHFLFGIGINPYYVFMEYTPTSSNAYYNSLAFYGFALNVIPALHYKLSSHFSIDLNAPISMYNLQREYYRQDNPILPVRQQRFHHTNHLFFEPIYTIRLGLRYRLTP